MKKIINEKESRVIYQGEIDELKDQIKYLVEVHPEFKQIIEEKDFEKFSSYGDSPQTMNERLDYDNENIVYGPNGTSENYKFLRIDYYSKLADEKFVEKYGKHSLEIILK